MTEKKSTPPDTVAGAKIGAAIGAGISGASAGALIGGAVAGLIGSIAGAVVVGAANIGLNTFDDSSDAAPDTESTDHSE